MAFTEAQRAAAKSPEALEKRRQTLAAKRNREVGGAVAVAPRETIEGDVIDPAQFAQELTGLAQAIVTAGDDKRRRDEAIDNIERSLAKISARDMPALLESETIEKLVQMVSDRKVAAGQLKPGMLIGEGLNAINIRPWTKSDLTPENGFEYVDRYVPRESIPVTWNGITVHFIEDVPMRLPKVFIEVYENSRVQSRAAQQHRDMLFASKEDRGAYTQVPADPSILEGAQGAKTRMLRGSFSGGTFVPGGGADVFVDPAHRPGYEEVEGEAAGAEA